MKIGVLGAGSMGSGIAQVAASYGHNVVLYDTNIKAIEKAMDTMQKTLAKVVEKGKMTEDVKNALLSRIHSTDKMEEYAGCELIFEAIIENLEVKKSVFAKLEAIVGPDCILASNTSSLSIASIAAACQKPERVIGIHFFNPAPLMKLVEIIPAVQTSPETTEKAKAIIDSWEKLTVLTKDTPGFIVNRVARPFYGEALRILEEGLADIATIDWAMTELGAFRMGPFTLMDYIGNDINYTVTETVFSAFYFDPRYKPAFTQKRLAEAGYLGRKTGRGHYNYAEGAVMPQPNKDETLGRMILNRVLAMLINEAADALFWNVASREAIDTAMTNGVNYPKGLLKWADEIGIQEVVDRLDTLYNEYHEDRYRCSPLLRKMAKEGKSFY